MSKKATKLISLLLSVIMLLGIFPMQKSAGAANRSDSCQKSAIRQGTVTG